MCTVPLTTPYGNKTIKYGVFLLLVSQITAKSVTTTLSETSETASKKLAEKQTDADGKPVSETAVVEKNNSPSTTEGPSKAPESKPAQVEISSCSTTADPRSPITARIKIPKVTSLLLMDI